MDGRHQDRDSVLSADLVGYELYDPGVHGVWRELRRKDAHAAFTRLMNAKKQRLSILGQTLARSGIDLPSPENADDLAFDRLEQWYVLNVAADANDRSRLDPIWYSITSDIGLYLGDAMISRGPGTMWTFYTADRRADSYQEAVITGFSGVPNPKYYINPTYLVAELGHQALTQDRKLDHKFVEWVDWAAASAVE